MVPRSLSPFCSRRFSLVTILPFFDPKQLSSCSGKVDIQAMDPTCPSWTKLQSVSYGVPLPNVAFNKTATQSSTYNNNESQDGPHLAVDGNQNSFTHTKCNQAGINQWWKVDLEEVYTISSVSITNRLDCCGGRLHNFTIAFLDENENEVSVVHEPGQLGNQKSYSAGKEVLHNMFHTSLYHAILTQLSSTRPPPPSPPHSRSRLRQRTPHPDHPR